MTESRPAAHTSAARWWMILLLFLLFCGGGGWLIGQAPTQQPAAANDESPEAGPSVSGASARAPITESPRGAEAEVSPWMTMGAALDESRRTGKPVLIDFSADWCGPCRMMKQQVFDDRTRGRAVQTAVIPVSIVDRRREEGRNSPEVEDLQRRHQVDAFPTLVVLSPASGRTVKARGFGGADPTVEWITQAAKSVR